MQVEIVVKCMETDSGGRGLLGFRVMASFCLPLKNGQNLFQTMDVGVHGLLCTFSFSASPTHMDRFWCPHDVCAPVYIQCVFVHT